MARAQGARDAVDLATDTTWPVETKALLIAATPGARKIGSKRLNGAMGYKYMDTATTLVGLNE